MKRLIHSSWWKLLTIVLVLYTVIAGFLVTVPALPILNETIRNLFFHVPMWFGMTILFCLSMIFSVRYLSKGRTEDDLFSVELANAGILLGCLGLVTGMQWAYFTWGDWWVNDPKLNGAAIALLIYLAYFVLRNAFEDIDKRAKVSAVYNIFAFATLVPLIFILPRLTDSLHPGSGGNPGFDIYDLDNNMRYVFYPAVIGWTLMGLWVMSLRYRYRILRNHLLEQNIMP